MTTHNREAVIAAAKEAGFLYYGEFPNDYKCKIESLYAIAFEAGRQAEREECAQTCEEYQGSAETCAAAIRARGDMK